MYIFVFVCARESVSRLFEAYQYKEVRRSRHPILPRKNCLHVPGHQPIEHRVKQQQAQHMAQAEVIVHSHRVKQV